MNLFVSHFDGAIYYRTFFSLMIAALTMVHIASKFNASDNSIKKDGKLIV